MVRKRLRRRRFVGLLTATAAVGLAGCNGEQGTGTDGTADTPTGGDDEPTAEPTPDDEAEDSFVRVVHAVPDAPNVDILVDGEPVLEDVAFRTVSDYLSITAASHTVQIRVAEGADDETATDEATDAPDDTGAEGDETATEAAATADAANDTETGTSADETGAAEEGTGTPTDDGGSVLFDEEVTIPAGTSITVVALGELAADTVDVRLFEDDATAGEDDATAAEDETTEAEDDATVAETETATGEQTDDGDDSRLRVLHASPDAPNVDVALSGEEAPFVSDVAFGDASEYASLPAGAATVDVRAAGETDVVASADVDLAAQTPYTAFAMGYLRPDEADTDAAFGLTLATDTSGAESPGSSETTTDDEVATEEETATEAATTAEATEADDATETETDATTATSTPAPVGTETEAGTPAAGE
ncbi:DUF4397 domain-containing protein [Halobellus sp. GM3]|uniref:DUF4397 domain-containing protein n=1 Tax=Halobellus sp. GM3 TaxID=3458410 RepID=UPI00403DEA68